MDYNSGDTRFLCHEDEKRLIDIIASAQHEGEPLTSNEIILHAMKLHHDQCCKAIHFLATHNHPKLAEEINSFLMSPIREDFAPDFCARHGLLYRPGNLVDSIRIGACNRNRIAHFLIMYGSLFNRDPRLLWNADEMAIDRTSAKTYYASVENRPLVHDDWMKFHITSMIALSAGKVAKPLLLIPVCVIFPSELQDHVDSNACDICCSSNGSMTQYTFYI